MGEILRWMWDSAWWLLGGITVWLGLVWLIAAFCGLGSTDGPDPRVSIDRQIDEHKRRYEHG